MVVFLEKYWNFRIGLRRSVDILITEAGLELLKKMDEELEKQEIGLQNLSDEEARELNRLLDKIRDWFL